MMPGEPSEGTVRLVIRRPDDWHVHLRDGPMLAAVINYTARQFARAIVMPNLNPPVTTVAAAEAYRTRIVAALEPGVDFTPLMTCYLTDDLDQAEVAKGFSQGVFAACKLYPAHATTNSARGVTDFRKIYAVLETMERIGMPLLLHGEVTENHIDIFDREAVFIDRILTKIIADFPALRIVFEHITTAEAVRFVEAGGPNLAATITPHHLEINRNAMFDGGIRPHFYCLPVAKRETHRLALRRAATSGNPKFFLGTDSAPHAIGDKESACGCAGIFNAPFALESYAKTFEEEGALDHLEAFASENGPRFYGLPLNDSKIVLERTSSRVPHRLSAASTHIVPFHAGQALAWRFAGASIERRAMSPYCRRQASLATKHAKERAIARPFRFALGLELVATPDLDTDLLGTFSGEVPRAGTALAVCEYKARLGMAVTGLPFGLASEGSFGPHPFLPFIPAGLEIMTFVDDERSFVLSESFLAERTNYAHREARSIDDLSDWLPAISFPSHALIVRTKSDGPGAPVENEKGIVSIDRLQAAIDRAAANSNEGVAWVETDMRAHLNPTRMTAIRRLAFRLARRLATPCPACTAPGWGQTGTVKGLPCELCGTPTEMVLHQIFSCAVCDHREETPRLDSQTTISPQHCPYCNP